MVFVSGCVGGVGVGVCGFAGNEGRVAVVKSGREAMRLFCLDEIRDKLARSTFGKAKPKVLRCRESHSSLAGLLEGT